MHLIWNTRRGKQLLDEYGEPIEFHEKHTAEEYYSKHCSNMRHVIIREVIPQPDKEFKEQFYDK